MNPALQERIERGSVPEPNTGCWLWVGSLGAAGYGTISIGPKKMSAHRASYTAFVGEIPDGKVVRHGCDVKSCVNPQLKARADARKASIRRAKEARLAARQPSMRFNLLAPRAA